MVFHADNLSLTWNKLNYKGRRDLENGTCSYQELYIKIKTLCNFQHYVVYYNHIFTWNSFYCCCFINEGYLKTVLEHKKAVPLDKNSRLAKHLTNIIFV